MEILKCDNGLFKVTIKGISKSFYVEDYNLAIEIAFKLGGAR